MPDWTERLTEEEREIERRWRYGDGPVQRDVSALLHTIAALRALVEATAEGYAQLLDAYKFSNRRDREKLIHEAEMLILNTEWYFQPPAGPQSAALTEAEMRKRLEEK